MKKTLTVNLNNIVFHIDDDAYDMLQTYLSEIAEHFKSEDERKEIMNDIEARIAELFTEKLQKNKNVVNLADVQEIIEIMGKPSQYADDEEEAEKPKPDKNQQRTRRYYRDPENAVLGGVAAGLAAYFGWDVTLVRVVFAVFALLTSGVAIPIYIIVWLVAPQAVTASQRLEMQGEDVNVESIKTELNNVKNYMESEKFKQSATSIGERILDILKLFFKVIFGFVGAVLGIVGVVLVGALILLLFFLIFEPTVLSGFAPDIVSNWSVITPDKMVMLIISLILVVGCPIFLLIYWAIRIVSGRQNSSQTASWVVLILWLAGLFMFYSVGANTFIHLRNNDGHPMSINWTHNDSPLVEEVRTCEPFHSVDISGNIELILNSDSVQQVTISSPSDYLPKIFTKVEYGVLSIYSEQLFLNRTIKVNISSNSLKSITAKGASEIRTESQLVAPEFSIELLGASSADMDLNVAGKFDLEVKGASKIELTGSCDTFEVEGYGASEIIADSLIAKNVDVDVSGANHTKVFASESIVAKATGASEIECKGNPKSVKQSEHIGSTIRIE
jgi:phage shock protein PspC (stress-responsive transcriptional regulator)